MAPQTQTPPPAAPSPIPPVLPAQDAPLSLLRIKLAELNIQHAGLGAQWDGLRRQLDNMLQNNPARPGVQQQWADVGVEKANVEGQIASLQARIAAKEGRPIGTPGIPVVPGMPIFFNASNMVFPAVALGLLALAFPISVAWARRILRTAPKPAPVPSDVTMRLERIEQAIDTIAIEIERVSEGQRFVTRIMADRQSSSAPSAQSPADASTQAKQPLALGAGPIEPIVVPERERVREAITPH